jgi:hypothetical protein
VKTFDQHVANCINRTGNNLTLLLRPLMSEMPAPMHFHDDPFFPFSKAIIQATRHVVCGYVFDFPAYMAHGAAGARALERAIAYAGSDVVKILHGAFVGSDYIPMAYENALGADAVTLASFHDYTSFTTESNHGAFVITDKMDNVPDASHSIFDNSQNEFVLQNGTRLRLAGSDVLYSSFTDDYAQKCREALEAMLS